MKIAIIGAGLAGLTAASHLISAGFRVDLVEKSRGAGGRMATRRETWASLDLGAQYFTARSPAFRAQVASWLRMEGFEKCRSMAGGIEAWSQQIDSSIPRY